MDSLGDARPSLCRRVDVKYWLTIDTTRSPKMAEKHNNEADLKASSFIEGTINDSATAEALHLYHEVEGTDLEPEAARALRWKIDLRLLPLLCITYALQSIDKNTLSYAAVFGLQTDVGLKGTEYSWTGAIFYLGYLVWEFPTNVLLQRLPINYFMSGTVSRLAMIDVALLIPTGCHLGRLSHVPRCSVQLRWLSRSSHLSRCLRGVHQPRHYASLRHVLQA